MRKDSIISEFSPLPASALRPPAVARVIHCPQPLPFPVPPPGFAVILFQHDADCEGRPHRWHAADGSDGVDLEYGPAAC